MSIISEIVRSHIRFFGGAVVVEAFCVASAFSSLYLHLDPVDKFVTAITPYILDVLAKILSLF